MSQEQTAPSQAPETTPTAQDTPNQAPQQTDSSPYAKAFAALARREKEVRQQKEALKQQPQTSEDVYERRKLQYLAKTDPKKFLELGGLSLDDIVNTELEGKPPREAELYKETQELREELQALKQKYETQEKSQEEQQFESQIQEYKQGLSQYLESDKEKYKTISHTPNGIDLVFNLVAAHWDETFDKEAGTGQVLKIEEAFDAVEGYLQEQIKTIATRLGYQPPVESQPPTRPQEPAKPSYTLSNELTTTRPQDSDTSLLPHDEALKKLNQKFGFVK